MRFDWKNIVGEVHKSRPQFEKIPVIGITGNFGDKGCELAEGYWQCILEAGATPLIIPPTENPTVLYNTLLGIDALLLSGGADLNPLFMGEEPSPALHGINTRRDLSELMLISMAFDMQLPILGICRGCQLLSVALGGSVHQDIQEAFPQKKILKHSQDAVRNCPTHSVNIEKGTLLESIVQENKIYTNSFHHQAVNQPGPHLRISATAPDGIIEAVESNESKPILGVQWHPEAMGTNDHVTAALFRWIVQEAALYRKTADVHQRILSVDSHCDTPMKFHSQEERLTTLPRMYYGHLDATIMVAYLPQRERTPEALKTATDRANKILDELESYVQENNAHACLAATPQALYQAKQTGKKAIMRGIENGYAIGHDLSNIERFKQRGVVYITLCHNGDNDICDSARKSNNEHGGLSDFGRQTIQEMNRLGLMIDLSHASEQSFWDTLELSKQPVICSHSSCRALTDHPRNLTDQQMRALAAHGGVMQITLYEGFVSMNGRATIDEAIAHIEHAIQVMGIDHVGIGTDFDGDGGLPGIANAGEVMNITRELFRRGYDECDLRKLWGENLLRVMTIVQDI